MVEVRVVDPLRLAGVGLFAAGVGLAAVAKAAGPLPGEEPLLRAVVAEPGSAASDAFGVVSDATDLGPLALVALAGAVVLLTTRRWRSLGVLLTGVAVPWALNPVLKDVLARPRPDLLPLVDVSAYSLPAGHAVNTTALVLVGLAVLRHRVGRRTWRAALSVGALVLLLTATAQLVLARHWPSDLLVGALFAAGWVALVVSAAATDESSARG